MSIYVLAVTFNFDEFFAGSDILRRLLPENIFVIPAR
jgi:hypothetical protein